MLLQPGQGSVSGCTQNEFSEPAGWGSDLEPEKNLQLKAVP